MATETELTDLLDAIGDRAHTPESLINRLALAAVPPAPPHRRWLPISAAVAAVAASVVVSVAVRGHDPQQGAAAGPGPGPTVDHSTYRLPLDAYYASAAQERTLRRAQFALAQQCAQQRGVNVPTARFRAANPAEAFMEELANNVRPMTLHQARTLGYEFYSSGTSAVDTATAGLTPRQLEIFEGWNGTSKPAPARHKFLFNGGCFGQATRTLLKGAKPAPTPGITTLNGQPGLFDDDETVENVYLNKAYPGNHSPSVKQAQQRWSDCMDTHGYPGLSTTENTIEHLHALKSAAAKKQAVQDVRCKQSTGFMTVWVASMTDAQKAVVAAHATVLDGFKQRLATRMANATRALK